MKSRCKDYGYGINDVITFRGNYKKHRPKCAPWNIYTLMNEIRNSLPESNNSERAVFSAMAGGTDGG